MPRLAVYGFCGVLLIAGCAPSPAELRTRGISEFQLGPVDAARQTLQQVLDRRPSDSVALYYMGRVMFVEGFYEQAAYYFRCAVDADPSYTDARIWHSKARAATGAEAAGP